MSRAVPALAWGFLFVLPLTLVAQEDALEELYGDGVHAYNARDYVRAYNDLTRAIDNGSEDPRAFYYRGLTYLRLGRDPEAKADFQKASSIEMSDDDRFYPVSKSLERVQGRDRMLIERYRSRARLTAFQKRERQRFERYERIRKNEPNVLMPPTPGESTEMPGADEPQPQPPAEDEAADEGTEEMESDDAADNAAEPAEADAMPEDDAPPADDDPFNTPPAEAEAEMPEPGDAFDDAAPADDAEADAPATDEAPADEAPADEAPADEAPADETPADETPADATTQKVPTKKLAKSLLGALLGGYTKQKAETSGPPTVAPPGPPLGGPPAGLPPAGPPPNLGAAPPANAAPADPPAPAQNGAPAPKKPADDDPFAE